MWIRRFVQLQLGLCLFGFSAALMVRAGLGLDPWNVFHQGLSAQFGISLGTVVIAMGVLVMLMWIPLRQKPGLGTLSNIFVIGLALDASLALLPTVEGQGFRAALMVSGVLLNAIASAAYIGAGMGPGPRDGLMTGLNRRLGWSIRVSRLTVEIVVLGLGWLLGGTIGLGTIAYALAIGPLIQVFLPWFNATPKRDVSPAPSA
ncbi:MAG: hypothetical protein P0Y52_11320 [Candidatus Brevundimonas phytovorans]|nr:hypothetical protein [Brevundimonas sp.]WEK57127.1 MAG: hypothetical protein P0Y52_11320 [Brevundimonas sp.]